LLFDGQDIDRPEIRFAGGQIGRHHGNRCRDPSVDMRATTVVGGEGVEDAIAAFADSERLPGHSTRLGHRQFSGRLEECRQLAAFTRVSFQQRE
jgi:hypothetical protein